MGVETNSKNSYKVQEIYMGINDESYNNNLKKIGFVLLFMMEGQAKAWADQFIKHADNQNSNPGTLNLGTYANFHKVWSIPSLHMILLEMH